MLETTEFTPGPWRVELGSDKREWGYVRCDLGRNATCKGIAVARVTRICGAHSEANARLIAAAPDLYAALHALVNCVEPSPARWELARAAIAKAEGR